MTGLPELIVFQDGSASEKIHLISTIHHNIARTLSLYKFAQDPTNKIPYHRIYLPTIIGGNLKTGRLKNYNMSFS
jgi:hypothetical protein